MGSPKYLPLLPSHLIPSEDIIFKFFLCLVFLLNTIEDFSMLIVFPSKPHISLEYFAHEANFPLKPSVGLKNHLQTING
jgi:hypothetical protein